MTPSSSTPPAAPSATAFVDTVLWLKQVPLFADVESESLKLFVPAMLAREYGPGEVLFRQGDASSDVYLVTRGDTVIRIEQDGRVVATDSVRAGSCVGEMAALTGQPRSATVLAGSQGAAVLIVPGPRFRDLLLLQPSLGVNMLAMMSERLRQTELRKQHSALAQRADELGKSKAAADAAARAKADLLASMSHELRTPLNGIIGLTEMVLETSLTHSQREYLNLVRESGQSLLELINDVLDMSRLEAGRLELEVEPFELRDRLLDTLKTLAVRAHRKGVELACRISPEVPDSLRGDLARLRQIVVNLVGNAVKFTERGEIVVEVTSPERTATVVTLQVTVRDTGVGIPKEKLAQLFQPYAQADASIARRFGGTGLGLSIAAMLVAAMKGRIWVESAVGVGSEFHFTVDLQMDQAANQSSTATGRAALLGKRVLLADPHLTTAKILEEMLREWGLSVESVRTGADAARETERAAAGGRPYSLLLMDARIGEWLDWLQRIRTSQNLAAVVLLSADRMDDAVRCEELRILHLLKPLKPSELLSVLTENLLPASSAAVPGAAQDRSVTAALKERGKILLAEDGLVNQKLALALLAKKGYQVTLATTGQEVIALLDRQPFDLVLMDLKMPAMDGLEATRAIRAREQKTDRHLPIIAMTASNSPQDMQRCLTAGMDAFVSKPFRQEELFATMDKFLSPQPASAGDAAAVDWPAALQQAGGRHELLAERVSLLQQELPRVERDLVTAAGKQDPTSLRIAAHTLKVALGAFGAPRLAHLAEQLEEASREQNYARAAELLAAFQQESRRLAESLQRYSGATAL